MSFRPYPSHRPSGVEWLGPVPEYWRTKPFWALYRRVKRVGFPDEELLSVYRDYGIVRKSDRDDNFNNPSEDLNSYQLVEPGDLAMNKMKAWQGSLGVSSLRGIVSPAYFVFRAAHREEGRYLHYLLRSPPFAAGFMTISKGIRPNQWDIDPDHLSQVPVPLPPVEEQRGIVAFLDRETAKIDALVEEQHRLIELLKEKRQAVISHAVTKGLDRSAPMKHSGVKWLGHIPAHWEVTRVKHVCSNVVDCLHTTPIYDGELQYPAVRTADVDRGTLRLEEARLVSRDVYDERIQRLRPVAGDILYSREGERFGMAALVPPDVDLCLGQRMMMFRISSPHHSSYVMWALNAEAIYQQVLETVGGATSPHINISDIVNFYLAEPPSGEQAKIAAFIGCEVSKIDELVEAATEATLLLTERRAALISAAVTGKIDVRERAAAPPELEPA